MRVVQPPSASVISSASPIARTCWFGRSPSARSSCSTSTTRPILRVRADPSEMRPRSVAREMKRLLGPQEPQRRHMWVTSGVDRGDARDDVACQQADDLSVVQPSRHATIIPYTVCGNTNAYRRSRRVRPVSDPQTNMPRTPDGPSRDRLLPEPARRLTSRLWLRAPPNLVTACDRRRTK